MPKFSDEEKEQIYNSLLNEGEKKFIVKGLKKTTIDEIVNSVKIAKGSFYSFFDSKEHLYMMILSSCQLKMRKELDEYLENNNSQEPKKLIKNVFLSMIENTNKYPLITQTNSDVVVLLYKKLSKSILDEHMLEDQEIIEKLQSIGIVFKYDIPVITKAFQSLYIMYVSLENDKSRDRILDIFLNGFVAQIVGDNND